MAMSKSKKKKHQFELSPDSIKYITLVLLVAAILIHVSMAVWFDFTQDDAFITFRYAANYVDGNGLVFNAGERVEGYTNFLWLLFMTIGKLLTFDLILFSKILGVICSSLSFIMLFLVGREIAGEKSVLPGLACLLLSLVYSYAYWAVAGLETAAFTLMVVSAGYFFIRRSFLIVPVLAAATLLRPEGGLLFVYFVVFDIISRRQFSLYTATLSAAYILLLLPLAVFKLAYFGGLFPNPFYAKTDFTFYKYWDGLKYTGRFFYHYLGAGLFVLPGIYMLKKGGREFAAIFGLIFIYILYIITVGGDVLKVHRFFVPLMPLLAFTVVYGLSGLIRKSNLIPFLLVIVIVWQLWIPREYVKNYHFSEIRLTEKMKAIAVDLDATDSRDFSAATSTIGAFSYYLPGHDIIDMLGLTDTTIARHPDLPIEGIVTTWKESRFNISYLLSRQPDYILFSTGRKPSAPAEKALHLYSGFLNSYRMTTYYFEGYRHDIFKRFYSVPSPIKKDIDVAFINEYSKGFQFHAARQYEEALKAYSRSLNYIPDTVFTYAHYYISENLRNLGQHEQSYNLLLALSEADTLSYQIYHDLLIYEYSGTRNIEKATRYWNRLKKLVPWYLNQIEQNIGWNK